MNNILAFGMPSGPELLVILLIILLFFGAKRLPELAKGLGKSIKEFKRASSEAEETFKEAMKDEPKKPETPEASEKKDDDSSK